VEVDTAQVEFQKRAAAERALELVRAGTVIGLGTGTTTRYFIDALGRRVRDGLGVHAVVTSEESRWLAQQYGIPLVDDLTGPLDLAVDGADEIDRELNCIKGRGGALLREKIVAHASRRFVLIADETKLVRQLGRGTVPIEVLPFLWQVTSRAIESVGGAPELRMAGDRPYTTDNQNLVLDTRFSSVDQQLATLLHTIPGVLEHGIFLGMAQAAIVAGTSGVGVLGRLD
jgi:ribose 5-phosphate isomerase A